MPATPKLILFDYGGVLLRLNDPVTTFGFGLSRRDFNERWLRSPAVQAHERGQIGPETFARQLVDDMQLPYGWQELIARFNGWPDRVTAATSQLVQSIPADINCAILSNTNALHWAKQDIERDFGGRIAHTFLSFESGHVKPDPAAFHYVLQRLPYPPADILFIDDNPLNLATAGQLGMQCTHCEDVDDLARVLLDAGIVA